VLPGGFAGLERHQVCLDLHSVDLTVEALGAGKGARVGATEGALVGVFINVRTVT